MLLVLTAQKGSRCGFDDNWGMDKATAVKLLLQSSNPAAATVSGLAACAYVSAVKKSFLPPCGHVGDADCATFIQA